ncbi:hypothetical protein HOY82DRAFT_615421 [Tuber indicum]|nr:hypothetical protein HOY82DRAFT_615421 [Tuber indicum]
MANGLRAIHRFFQLSPHVHSLLGVSFGCLLRRRSVVLTRSRKVITCIRRKIVLIVGKYECLVEAMSMEKGCSSLEIMKTIGRKQAGSIRCMKARKH